MKNFLKQSYDTIFLMLGKECNFQCKYCLQDFKGVDNYTKERSVKLVEYNPDILNFIEEIVNNQERRFRIQFFGGEPLLYWEHIVDIVNKLKERGIDKNNLDFSIVSNGFLLDDEKVEFFNENNFNFGLSWDGPNTKLTRNIDVLEDSKIKECFFKLNSTCISAVMSSLTYPLEVLDTFSTLKTECDKYREENNLEKNNMCVNIDIILDTNLLSKELTKIDTARLYNEMKIMCAEYEKMLTEKDKEKINWLYVSFIQNQIHSLKNNVRVLTDEDGIISTTYCGNGYNILNMDLEGNLYFCHNNINTKLGNIYSNYFSYLKKLIHFDGTKLSNEKCSDCAVQYLCKNGCPLVPNEGREGYYCDTKIAFYTNTFELIKKLTKI